MTHETLTRNQDYCDDEWLNTRKKLLRPSHTAAITKTLTITMQRVRILMVESLHVESKHAHSTNIMCSLCVVIVIVLVIAAVGPSLNHQMQTK